MSKAYSNKALPPGTVLREWRLDEVLGVGGFGIVYKAHGIYFNELVAIKEYFPSSISERDSDDTVVPIDSDAEEVHALGLKKFVEEAKLLWNLSTPTRQPSIVSVRSLFEIHGTAYMVMDFEDGLSLSRMLKQGRRFNERSLWSILQPIAQGLDRAHRVGVLHRDIKPANILINEDNRPVLIDFGSARFDTGEATSTKVTFHTPPYAALEQYVKTYPQGPWTDIYALGVVMYECITGEKPPEVLERLHGGLGTALASGKWPGYSKKFLTAVDAAMIVKPDERPQSLGEWLALFGKPDQATDIADDEATRFYAKQVETPEIAPVPAIADVDPNVVETGVPVDRKGAKFKRAGEETRTETKILSTAAVATAALEQNSGTADAQPPAVSTAKQSGSTGSGKKKPSPLLFGGIAAAVLAVAAIGAVTLRGRSDDPELTLARPSANSTPMAVPTPATPSASANAPVEAPQANSTQPPPPAPTAPQPPAAESNTEKAIAAEKAKTAAAEAQLAALKKKQSKAAAPLTPTVQVASIKPKTAKVASDVPGNGDVGVTPATMAQFNAAVEDARSLAKQVMHSASGQSVQSAKTYDRYLKTLKASMAGVTTEKEAQRLLKQAQQTRTYIATLH